MENNKETGRKGDRANMHEATFQTLFERSADAMFVLDGDHFIDCNQSALDLMRCTKEQLMSLHPSQISPAQQPDGCDSVEKSEEMMRAAYEQGSHTFDWVHLRFDGETFFAEVSLTAASSGGQQFILAIVRDVTERKLAEEQLQQSENLYRTLVNSQQGGVFIIQKGNIIVTNPILAATVGYPLEELSGMPFIKLIAPEDHEMVLDIYQKRQSGAKAPDEYLLRLLKKDGETRVATKVRSIAVPYNGYVATVGTIINVDEQLRMEAELRESAEKMRAMFESITDGITLSDLSGKIVEANEAIVRLHQYSTREEVLGKEVTAFISPEDRERVMGNMQRTLEAGTSGSIECKLLRKDGTIFDAELNSSVVKDAEGNLSGFLTTTRDVTERKQAEAERSRLVNILEATNDFVAIATLQGSMVYINKAGRSMLGYGEDEDMSNLRIPDTHPAWVNELMGREAIPTVMQKGIWSGETALLTRDGRELSILQTLMIHKDAEGRPELLSTVSRDISDRKQAEVERERLATIIESATDFIGTSDMEANLLYLNKAGREMLGLGADEDLSQRKMLEFSPPWVGEMMFGKVFPIALEKGGWSGEAALTAPDGSEIPVSQLVMIHKDSTGKPLYISTIARDIRERKQFEKQLQEMVALRGSQVETSTQIAQEIASATELEELFNRVVTLVKDRFGYYHTQLLRYEPALNMVVLVVGYGETGRQMVAAGHRMEMGRGLIGVAAATGQTVMRANIVEDADWRPNPLLPNTKGEIAVPIKFGERVLGVLDVQSDQVDALTEDDRLLLEGLCGQIAIAIEGTSLRQEMQERLNELNNLYRATSREGWQAFRENANLQRGYLFDRIEVQEAADVWVEQIEAAIQEKRLAVGGHAPDQPDSATVAPLSVRGEVIGALGVYDDVQNPLTDDDLTLIEQVSDQVALALESARLFEQARVALGETEEQRALLQQELVERQRTQEALTGALRTARMGYWELDLATMIFTFNDEFYAMLHTTAEAEGGYQMSVEKYATKFAYPDDASLVAEETMKAIQTTDPNYVSNLEHRFLYADGEMGYIDVSITVVKDENGKTVKTRGANQDITERKLAAMAIEEQQRTLQVVLDNMPAGVFMVEAPSGKPILSNKRAEALLGRGISPEATQSDINQVYQAYRYGTEDLYPPEEMPVTAGLFGEARTISDMEVRRPNGTRVLLEASGTPVYNASGALVASLVVFQDITESFKAQQEIAHQHALLRSLIELCSRSDLL